MFMKCILLVMISIHLSTGLTKDYGPFNLTITRFVMCEGPKHKNCATSIAHISDYYALKYDLNVLQNTTPTKGKIVALSNGKEFMRLQVKNPCDHLFLRPLFGVLMNVTQNCVIKKGQYSFIIDIKDIAISYFGGTFLYGNWTFKSLFFSETCNFSCAVIDVTLSPLLKEK